MKRKRGTEVLRHTEWRKVMTMDEVAEYLRVHRTTIYRLIKRHKIPAFRVGKNWRFNIEDVNRWLQQKKSRRARFGSCVA
jgi:excisionase family DNA binding protein